MAVSHCMYLHTTFRCEILFLHLWILFIFVFFRQHSRDADSSRHQEDGGGSYITNIGRSLLGGYTQQYIPDLALHGTFSLDLAQVGSDLVSSAEVMKRSTTYHINFWQKCIWFFIATLLWLLSSYWNKIQQSWKCSTTDWKYVFSYRSGRR